MAELFKLGEDGAEALGAMSSFIKNGPMATQMMALRCLVNMSKNNSSAAALNAHMKGIVDNVAPKLKDANKNVRNSAYTLLINYSIVLIDKKDSQGKLHILQYLTDPCKQESDCKNYQKLATLVGNLVDNDEEVLALALSHGISLKDPSSLQDKDEAAFKIVTDIKADFGF